MFNLEEYYKLYNAAALTQYEQQKVKIAELADMKLGKSNKEALPRFVKEQAEFLKLLNHWEQKATEDYYRTASMAELAEDQDKIYKITESEYFKSSLCPSFMTKSFGQELGPVLAHLAYKMRENVVYATRHMRFAMSWNQELFLNVAELLLKNSRVRVDEVVRLIKESAISHAKERAGLLMHDHYIFDGCHGEDWIREGDLSDPGTLYALGVRVSKEDLALAKFMNTLSDEQIDKMAHSLVDGYRRGFFVDGQDIVSKKTVGIYHRLGMERMTRRVMELFESEIRFIPFIGRISGTRYNQQCEYDHRFDLALVLDEEYIEATIGALENEMEQNQAMLAVYGGPAAIGSFGEATFKPQNRKGNITFRKEQSELYGVFMDKRMDLFEKYMPSSGTSFTMVAYPVPQIGKDFEQIFIETLKINTLDNEQYLKVQQHIIDALDLGTEVQILGCDGNETNLTVAMPPIENPKRQTNFYNCVADVNIPLGEIFTSPKLEGTNGVLHVDSFYARGMQFKDLKITFQDGYVSDYTCANFANEEENRKFVQENLLFPHETLPMGEFAVGTNTLAYKMAKEFNIVEQLPILIVEKMGPHFAIGDTCYVGTEDLAIYNPQNGKEIVARENEKTALRKTDRAQAYTHAHTDITLPYHGIGLICVKCASGQTIDIIRNGRFVLRGTELLNEALKALEEAKNE